jgi:hypothetical protein
MALGALTKLSKHVQQLINIVGTQGADYISYLSPLAGAITRTIRAKLLDNVTIKDFGAIGDGINDDGVAIGKMATALGYVVYPAGNFLTATNLTITVPQFFREGAVLTVGTGTTLSIYNRVHSSNQWIFQGTGVVLFLINSTGGEDSQRIHGGWFGVHPYNTTVVDVTARLQRALSSLSTQTREGILQIEQGSFHLSGTLFVPRGVHLAGRGTRRTIFDISGAADWTVFETAGNACKFTGFQFEYPSGQGKVRTAPYIHVKHNTCDIIDLHLYPSTCGILIDQPQCYIKNLRVTYGLDPKSVGVLDTSLIWCRASSFTIDTVAVLATTYFPDHLIRVGHDTTISAGQIRGIQSTSSCMSVYFDGRACSITRVSVTEVMSSPSGGNQFPAVIKVEAAGAFIVNYLTLSDIVGSTYADSLLHVEGAGTSIISNISLGSGSLHGAPGYGVRLLNNGTGSLRYIHIGNDVDVTSRATRLQTVGSCTFLSLPPSMKGNQQQAAYVDNVSIGDDAVVIIKDFRGSIYAGTLIIASSNPAIWGIFSFRSASSSNHVTMMVGHANMAVSTGTLTGTTGVDGKFTVGINASGELVLENRIGVGATLNMNMFAGI